MKNYPGKKNLLACSRPRAFTLVEVVVSVLLLVILLSGVFDAYRRTSDRIMQQILRERAASVAQRRMEFLLASRQEPNSHALHGRDEIDPTFNWRLNLQREYIPSLAAQSKISSSVIKATIIVEAGLPEREKQPLVQLVRLFGSLKPLPGQDLAVPFLQEEQEPAWYAELKAKLGREPTLEEALFVLMQSGDISDEEFEILNEPNETQEP